MYSFRLKYFQILGFIAIGFISSCQRNNKCDLVLRNGLIIDGTGEPAYTGDIAINADTIVAIGNLWRYSGNKEIDIAISNKV
jgi:N-acyl-D-amino-acid deacylase